MKVLFAIGVVVLILGVVSLIVPVPHRDRDGVKIGDVSIGITTQHDEKLPVVVSAAMILAGVGLLVAARSKMA